MAFPIDTQLHVTLNDGTTVLLRPVQPTDRAMLEKGLEELSSRSRLMRFFSPFAHLTDRQLSYLTDVDQDVHVAWGAALEGEEVVGLGIGRFARLAEDPETAEVAITVLDPYQGRGIGGLLLALLYRVGQHLELKRFRANVLFDNHQLMHALIGLGGHVVNHEEGVAEVDIPLVAPDEELPGSREGQALRDALHKIDDAIEAART